MSSGSILHSCFHHLNQHLKFIFLDVLWRLIWLVCAVLAAVLAVLRVIGQVGAMEWNGPDLGGSSPIILLAALRQFWDAHGATLLGEMGLLLLSVLILWVVLEALFRGGRKGFWVYLGTSIGRLSLLGGACAFFGLLAFRDDTGGTFLIGAVVMLGLWFLVSLLETAIRRDAVMLFAVEFPKLLAVFGTLLGLEMFLGFVLWGSAIAALMGASSSSDFSAAAIAVAIVAVAVPFWMVLHSYLVAIRFTAMDIINEECRR